MFGGVYGLDMASGSLSVNFQGCVPVLLKVWYLNTFCLCLYHCELFQNLNSCSSLKEDGISLSDIRQEEREAVEWVRKDGLLPYPLEL